MTDEELLVHLVREWTDVALPGDPTAADAAAGHALRCYAAGASVGEACQGARAFLRCWARHPSHQSVRHDGRLRVAS